MKGKLTSMAVIFALAMLSSLSFAVPGVPEQFWGAATINGAAAPDGTVITAKINGAPAGSALASAGSYNIIVEDPNNMNTGKQVLLYVNGVQAGSETFANGKITQLNLAITVSEQAQTTTTTTSSGGGGGGGGSSAPAATTETKAPPATTPQTTASSSPCTERWLCTDWTACTGGASTRQCEDVNKCGTESDKPMMSQPCGTDLKTTSASTQAASQPASGIAGLTGMFWSASSAVIVPAILLILAVAGYSIYQGKNKPKRR